MWNFFSNTSQACCSQISPYNKQITNVAVSWERSGEIAQVTFAIGYQRKKKESPAALLQIDFLNKNIYLKLKDTHFGFSTEEELKNLKRQIKYLQLISKLLKKKLLLQSFLLLKRCQKKARKNCRCFDGFDGFIDTTSSLK